MVLQVLQVLLEQLEQAIHLNLLEHQVLVVPQVLQELEVQVTIVELAEQVVHQVQLVPQVQMVSLIQVEQAVHLELVVQQELQVQ